MHNLVYTLRDTSGSRPQLDERFAAFAERYPVVISEWSDAGPDLGRSAIANAGLFDRLQVGWCAGNWNAPPRLVEEPRLHRFAETRFGLIVRRALAQFHGREVKSTGDGFLATFDGPARAIRCAREIIESSEPRGIRVRAGLHTGECEVMGEDIGGIAVHIAARVSANAGPGDVVVSRTVIVCTQFVVFPHSSEAIQVRAITFVPAQLFVTTSV